MTIHRTDIVVFGPEVGPKSSELSLIWNLVTRIAPSKRYELREKNKWTRRERKQQKSQSLPVMGRIGVSTLTRNGADLLLVLYGIERRYIDECTAFNYATEREAYRQRPCQKMEFH
ncbi:hypothetical protein [Methanogenium organophilum]|uniref:Uncharacterized protein n=1 Tax=Methanogenium organophilum TaxID=2199 RepID=A0A9X9S424_METOG|nr:hypothetical protein [Methanogenium organophilum]WAI01161.1 hypothetical protein OU421_12205 [Methanogenium organophilum]